MEYAPDVSFQSTIEIDTQTDLKLLIPSQIKRAIFMETKNDWRRFEFWEINLSDIKFLDLLDMGIFCVDILSPSLNYTMYELVLISFKEMT